MYTNKEGGEAEYMVTCPCHDSSQVMTTSRFYLLETIANQSGLFPNAILENLRKAILEHKTLVATQETITVTELGC
jgi:hypothetical protein